MTHSPPFFLPLEPLGILAVSGPDRRSWLQGMLTNDVVEPFEGRPRYALVLDGKGRVVADALVVDAPGADRFFLILGTPASAPVREHLSRMLVAEDVELLSLDDDISVITVQGAGAAGLADQAVATSGACPAMVVAHDRSGQGGVDMLVTSSQRHAVLEALANTGVTRATGEHLEALRIAAGIPKWGADFDTGTLPQEAGLHDALHWGKGCYLGQEVVARLGHRGQTARELRRLRLETPVSAGTELFLADDPERAVGSVTSVAPSVEGAGWVALGMVRRRAMDAGTVLQAGRGGMSVTVIGDRLRSHVPLEPHNDPTFRANRPQRGLGR